MSVKNLEKLNIWLGHAPKDTLFIFYFVKAFWRRIWHVCFLILKKIKNFRGEHNMYILKRIVPVVFFQSLINKRERSPPTRCDFLLCVQPINRQKMSLDGTFLIKMVIFWLISKLHICFFFFRENNSTLEINSKLACPVCIPQAMSSCKPKFYLALTTGKISKYFYQYFGV